MTLEAFLQDPVRTGAFVADGARLVDREVASKTGMRAFALKAGFKAIKTVRPDIVEEMLRMMLPKFAKAVDVHYAKAVEHGDVRGYFVDHADEIGESLLSVTDERARIAKHALLKKVYAGLRPTALRNVVEAMPGVAELLEKHIR